MSRVLGVNDFNILPEDIAGGVYLDLDRTILKTTDLWEQTWRVLAQNYSHIDGELEYSRLNEHFNYPENASYFYDFDSHLDDVKIDRQAAYRCLQNSDMADGRLEYDDTVKLVEWISQAVGRVRVLTYGLDSVQMLKVSLAPSLADADIYTTMGSKADYFKENGIINAVLLDDKSIGHELAEVGVKFIQVLHHGEPHQTVEPTLWPVAHSLEEARLLLEKSA